MLMPCLHKTSLSSQKIFGHGKWQQTSLRVWQGEVRFDHYSAHWSSTDSFQLTIAVLSQWEFSKYHQMPRAHSPPEAVIEIEAASCLRPVASHCSQSSLWRQLETLSSTQELQAPPVVKQSWEPLSASNNICEAECKHRRAPG